jgi:N-carbamoyl-L-amino-acid hydrolase
MNRRRFLHHAAAFAAAPAIRIPLARAPLRANGVRLNGWLARFDAVGRTPGGINRVGYSEADLAGRAFTQSLMREAGLTPRIDAAGNIVARLDGTDRSLPPIVIGSHVDSVTDGGNFDGPLGSFSAIEVARSLQEQRIRLRHPLEVVVWSNEEGGVIGSKLAVGDFAKVELDSVARSGKTIREGIGIVGGDAARLQDGVRAKGSAHCYLELHIEQGGSLEREGLQVGVVTGIVGLRWLEVVVEGFANHAGTTAMDQRQDALLAASKLVVAINDAVRAEPGRQVATVGRLVPEPNTRNVIPGRVTFSVDLRDLEATRIAHFERRFQQLAREVAAATRTTVTMRTVTSSEPAMAAGHVMDWIDGATTTLGLTRQRMPSGAGHDAQEMALVAPMGMIFVPSVGGISHSPREFTKAADCANGVDVLLNAVVGADR